MTESDVAVLNTKIDQVLFILENNNKTGTKGLVAQVDELKTAMNSHKQEFTDFVKKKDLEEANKAGWDKAWKIIYGAIGAIGVFLAKAVATAVSHFIF
mgnify:CR=1 FL=1